MSESIEVFTILPATPTQIYRAWLDSAEHSAFTGGEARIDPQEGGYFTAWDGYIMGTTLQLEPYRRILQAWRTTEFPDGSSDSRLEILLDETTGGTRLTLIHTGLPEGQGEGYRQGWEDYYFEPMQSYFEPQE